MGKQTNEPKDSVLTNKMDFGTKGFDEFQSILLKKSNERSIQQKQKIELLNLKFQMEDYINSELEEVKLAGYFLKRILKTLQIQQNKFADYLGLKPSNLSKLLNGDRPINYDLALIFGKLFNHSPMLWIEIQAKNELRSLMKTKSENDYNYSLSDLMIRNKNEIK